MSRTPPELIDTGAANPLMAAYFLNEDGPGDEAEEEDEEEEDDEDEDDDEPEGHGEGYSE
jgi:hypothetical protein